MSFFNSLNTSASGLTAQRLRMDVISENIANASTTRTAEGGPYKKKAVIFEERNENFVPFSSYFNNEISKGSTGNGVRVTGIREDSTEGSLVYDPEHPEANEEGYVEMPNVNVVEEMVDMISASRTYEANVTAFNTVKTMISKTLEISTR